MTIESNKLTKLTVIKTLSHGLEVYKLYHGHTLITQTFSEVFAMTAYHRLLNKLINQSN